MSAVSISSSSSFSTAGPVGADAGPLAFAYPNADQQRTRTGSFASTNNLQTQPALTLNAFFTDIASYKSSMTAASSATEYVSIVSAEYIVTAADASDIRGHPAAAASTMTATCKSQSPQGAFPGYGPGPFGGRDSVAIPLLCIASLALTAGIVLFVGWKRMDRRRRRTGEGKALRKSTLKVEEV